MTALASLYARYPNAFRVACLALFLALAACNTGGGNSGGGGGGY